jgi:phospholipid/cholesterol/gamma-HCH transport system substrate-binding protein
VNKQAPSLGQLITIAGFALSCFGLLLFVWVAFGGPTPLAAKGYTLKLPLVQVGQLAEQAEVRISGVEVGRVSSVKLPEGGDSHRAIVTLNIDPEYAPVPADTRAVLRAKTLLGEAYIELTPGDKRDGTLEDGATLPDAQVARSVQLDEIFRTFDKKTRDAFKQGAIDNAVATKGRGAALNQTLGVLPGTFTELQKVLQILDDQNEDVTKLVRNTGVVFNAISTRQGQLSGLIRNSNTVFQTTAARDQDLQDWFRIFPTFLTESRVTQQRLGDFSEFATPIVNKLVPVAKQLSPTLKASAELAPASERLYRGLKPVIHKAPKAFPSLRAFLDEDATSLLRRIPDYFAELNPLLQTGSYYRRELAGFLGNAAAATNGKSFASARPDVLGVRYLRAGVTQGPSAFGAMPSRSASNRSNPYVAQGGALDVGSGGLKAFQTFNCGTGYNATMKPWGALTPVQQAQFTSATKYLNAADSEFLYGRVNDLALAGRAQIADVPAPGCTAQAPFDPIGDPSQPSTQYQHVFRDSTP